MLQQRRAYLAELINEGLKSAFIGVDTVAEALEEVVS